jgi:hypothetical protein
MSIPESVVAQVVADVSSRMSDPGYAQLAIGGFVQAHPDVGRYLSAHLDELGGGEAVMHAVFHAEVMNDCYRRHLGRELRPIRFRDLDAVANVTSSAGASSTLQKLEPALADYLASNVEEEAMRRVLALVAVAMSRAAQ